jgi:hypothetical protein
VCYARAAQVLPTEAVASMLAHAVDVSDAGASMLSELRLAGGDVPRLAAMAKDARERSELTAELKRLGFKGLRTRQKLTEELKEWRPGRGGA